MTEHSRRNPRGPRAPNTTHVPQATCHWYPWPRRVGRTEHRARGREAVHGLPWQPLPAARPTHLQTSCGGSEWTTSPHGACCARPHRAAACAGAVLVLTKDLGSQHGHLALGRLQPPRASHSCAHACRGAESPDPAVALTHTGRGVREAGTELQPGTGFAPTCWQLLELGMRQHDAT